jgi:beta-mannosidase
MMSFNINGENVFMKGANYVPTDIIFQSEEKKSLILKEAKLANFNMIRIWGGGFYESD